MECRACHNLDYPQTKSYYRDPLCRIIGTDDGIVAIYAYHQTPHPRHKKWIELQLDIVAKRLYNRSWKMEYLNFDHPCWTVKPAPDIRVRKCDKPYSRPEVRKEFAYA